jgi:hypothetical protein
MSFASEADSLTPREAVANEGCSGYEERPGDGAFFLAATSGGVRLFAVFAVSGLRGRSGSRSPQLKRASGIRSSASPNWRSAELELDNIDIGTPAAQRNLQAVHHFQRRKQLLKVRIQNYF